MTTEMITAERPSNGAGLSVREGFEGREMTTRHETASTAVAAQATAAVQARYVMARKFPRDWDNVRISLLKECQRPGFADGARYNVPRGYKDGKQQFISGPSIRFAEAVIRCMGNLLPEVTALYDDDEKRIIRVSVTELEGNVTYSADVIVQKTIERSTLKKGQEAIGERLNSEGRRVFIVAATDDELLNKQAALVSKTLRTLALRLLPGDILDEAMDAVTATLAKKDATDPDAARKKIADSFASLGVMPAQLKEYLGHDLAGCAPAELGDLRALFAAIRDGEGTWHQALEARLAYRANEQTPSAAAQVAQGQGLAGKVAAKKAQAATPETKAEPANFAPREPGAEG